MMEWNGGVEWNGMEWNGHTQKMGVFDRLICTSAPDLGLS